jgi:hypothetical protein
VHERAEAVDERRWADYVELLDRGLDELDIEVSRAAESADPGPGVAEVLAIHSSALELAGWRMRFSLHDDAAPEVTAVRASVAVAESELARRRTARGTDARIPGEALERSMEQVRQAARQVGSGA